MREYQGPVRFGTEKVVGFPRLIAIFEIVRPPASSVDGGTVSGARLRIFGLAKC
jgi:hypothetical protein